MKDEQRTKKELIKELNQLRRRISRLEKNQTKHEQTEMALRKIENNLSKAQKVAHVGSWDWDILANELHWTDEIYRIFGLKPHEFRATYDAFLASVYPDDRAFVQKHVDAAINDNKEYSIDHRIKLPNGEVRIVHEQAEVVYDDAGKPVRMIGTVQDITERKLAEETLAAESERLAVTLRSIGDGVITTDAQGNIVLLNKVAELLTGWTEKQARGRHISMIFDIIDERTGHPCENPVDKVIENGVVVNLMNSTLLKSKDGAERVIADSGAPIRDRGGKIIGVVVVFRDITEARRVEELISRAQRLETAGRIAGQVAHDFNNLLGPLVAYPEFIRDKLPEDHEALPFLNDMEQAATQIADINKQLLTLGRRGHYNQESINLNQIVLQVLNQFKPTPETLVIETDLNKEPMNIRGGTSQIYRAILNLVTNACDSMKNVGCLTVKTENYYADNLIGKFGPIPKGEYVKLTITDTGCGIPKEIENKIFDPFYTTKTTDKRRGSGLGLSVAYSVIEDHDGYIDLESDVGTGSSFYVYFPISREPEDKISVDDIKGGNETILLIDDDLVQQDITMNLLLKLGYKASAMGSGEKALEYLKQNPQDLLILDMLMPPGIDGTETYKQALEINHSQKTIIISGYAETERVEEALRLGAGAFMRKPLTLESIAKAVRQELDRKPHKLPAE